MEPEIGVNHVGPENFTTLSSAEVQSIDQQRTKRAPQPFVRGDVETDLLALQNLWRQLVIHQFLEYEFLPGTADLEGSRQLGGKLNKAVIEKRRPHLDGVGHTHAVALRQNVIGEKIFLIEPKIRRQIIRRGRQSIKFGQYPVE